MRFRPLFSLGFCLASGVFVAATAQNAQKTPRKIPAAPNPNQNGAVNVNGDTSITDGATNISKLLGNVTVTQTGEDFILYAQRLTYNEPQNRAVATEKLRVETRDSTVRGLRIDADFNSKILTLTGNVSISTHGKSDGINGNRAGKNLREQFTSKPSKLFCDRVDWDYETRQAVLTGNIRMQQGKNSGTCQRIEFDEHQNVARLLGAVRFTDEKGQVYSTPDLTIYNNENRIVTGRSRIRILPNTAPGTTPRAPKPAVVPQKAPVISEEDLREFNVKPSPIPTLRPEPTEVPAPEPAPEAEEAAPVEAIG